MKLRLFLLSLAAAFLTGCCSTSVTTKGGRTMCDVDNACLFLFVKIPLLSGDPNNPNENTFVGFENTSTLENNMRLIKHEMSINNAQAVRNLTSFRAEEQIFFFILKRSVLHTSAELVKDPRR